MGYLFWVSKKAYWGNGLGSILMEEAIEWAQSSGSIRRLQLTVQNEIWQLFIYIKKLGFIIEGQQERGACIEGGEFLDVYLMGRLMDK